MFLSVWTVHPHVRGENARFRSPAPSTSGSPPRAWGKRINAPALVFNNRFTPTCVGKTAQRARHPQTSTVHPHVRGENEASENAAVAIVGSPPRAWGKRAGLCVGGSKSRFTPTCVGKTSPFLSQPGMRPVHPHVRGENSASGGGETTTNGSPPRAWGKRINFRPRPAHRRFTPTCVGKTRIFPRNQSAMPVHPHVRGENSLEAGKPGYIDGSPPRAWGKQLSLRNAVARLRFTPTCVGKTRWPGSSRWPGSVHPHVRGENLEVQADSRSEIGSPPRAWGKRFRAPADGLNLRFTPTCVGKTD